MKHLLLSLIMSFSLLNGATLTLVAKEQCPYYCSEQGDEKGFVVDIATRIFEQLGYKVRYKTVTSEESALKGLDEKEFDAFLSDSHPMGSTLIFAKTPIAYRYDVILLPKYSKWQLQDPDSLSQLRIGLCEERSYSPLIEQHLKKYRHDKEKVNMSSGKFSLKDALKKLKYSKVDAIIGNQHQMQYFYHQKRKDFPFKVAQKLESTPINILFSERNYKAKKHAQQFNRAFKKLQGTPDMDLLLKKYGLLEQHIQRPEK